MRQPKKGTIKEQSFLTQDLTILPKSENFQSISNKLNDHVWQFHAFIYKRLFVKVLRVHGVQQRKSLIQFLIKIVFIQKSSCLFHVLWNYMCESKKERKHSSSYLLRRHHFQIFFGDKSIFYTGKRRKMTFQNIFAKRREVRTVKASKKG